MYSVVKGNCAAQPERWHLGEPGELRLNRKFLTYSHELLHIVSPVSSVCGMNMPLIQLWGEPRRLENPKLGNERVVPAATVSF